MSELATLEPQLPEPEEAQEPKRTKAEIAVRICRRVSRGQRFKVACEREGVSRSLFRMWLDSMPGLQERWDRARVDQAHAMAEDTIAIADEHAVGMDQVQRNRTRVAARQWYTSKIAPKIYGDRVEHQHAHTVGVVMLPAIAGAVQAQQAQVLPALSKADERAIEADPRQTKAELLSTQELARRVARSSSAFSDEPILRLRSVNPNVTRDSQSPAISGVSDGGTEPSVPDES